MIVRSMGSGVCGRVGVEVEKDEDQDPCSAGLVGGIQVVIHLYGPRLWCLGGGC